jgi:putative nucleotidyltransferase with HDIG domain
MRESTVERGAVHPTAGVFGKASNEGGFTKNIDTPEGLTSLAFRGADLKNPVVSVLYRLGLEQRERLWDHGDADLMREIEFFRADQNKHAVAPETGGKMRLFARPKNALVGVLKKEKSLKNGNPSDALNDPKDRPAVYDLLKKAALSEASGMRVAELIEGDESLASKLMLVFRLASGEGKTAVSIPRAAALLGARETAALAGVVSIMDEFEGIPHIVLPMAAMFDHSLGTACLARIIAEKVGSCDAAACFTAGFLHDVGRIVAFNAEPDLALQAMERSRKEQVSLHYLEPDLLGYDHGAAGDAFLEGWNCPEDVRRIVRHHHIPELFDDPLHNTVVHTADIMAHTLCLGTGGEFFVPALREAAWSRLGLAPAALIEICDRFMDMAHAEVLHTPLQEETVEKQTVERQTIEGQPQECLQAGSEATAQGKQGAEPAVETLFDFY